MTRITKFFKDFIQYLGTFPNAFSENSTKLLALLISAITGGFLMGIVIPFTLIWDVVTNGHIQTDLMDYGVFLLCISGVMVGAGLNVKVPEWFDKKRRRDGKRMADIIPEEEEFEDDSESEKEE